MLFNMVLELLKVKWVLDPKTCQIDIILKRHVEYLILKNIKRPHRTC